MCLTCMSSISSTLSCGKSISECTELVGAFYEMIEIYHSAGNQHMVRIQHKAFQKGLLKKPQTDFLRTLQTHLLCCRKTMSLGNRTRQYGLGMTGQRCVCSRVKTAPGKTQSKSHHSSFLLQPFFLSLPLSPPRIQERMKGMDQ